MYSKDSDILPHEPLAFHELPFVSQTKLRVNDAVLTGFTLSSVTGGLSELAAGDVGVIGDGAYEIAFIDDDHAVTLAKKPVATSPTLVVRTFEPQRRIAHERIRHALWLAEGEEIVSTSHARRLEVLGTLAGAYAAAAMAGSDNQAVLEKAERYKDLYFDALYSGVVEVDTNGDGFADEQRCAGIGRLIRD